MRINKIVNDSTAEVEGHFCDIIFFQGCTRNCSFCFNPELKSFEGGEVVDEDTILYRLSELSDVVVLTGGDPLCQNKMELEVLIKSIKRTGRKVVLETSFFDDKIYKLCDLILMSIKKISFDFDTLKRIKSHSNIRIMFVYGHQAFNLKDAKKCLKTNVKEWYVRYFNDLPFPPGSYLELWKIFKASGKNLKVFNKLRL